MPTTRLPDPVQLSDDLIRHYQLRPIPGQLILFTNSNLLYGGYVYLTR